MPDEVSRFHEAGMHGCLTKPIRKKELKYAIEAVLTQQNDERRDMEATALSKIMQALLVDISVLDELEAATSSDLVFRVVDKYLEEAEANLRLAQLAVEAADLSALRKVAHSLCGSSSAMGANRLEQMVAIIERYCIEGKTGAAIEIAQQLDVVGAETLHALQILAKDRTAASRAEAI